MLDTSDAFDTPQLQLKINDLFRNLMVVVISGHKEHTVFRAEKFLLPNIVLTHMAVRVTLHASSRQPHTVQ